MTYEYDAFFSYKRHSLSDAWHEGVKERISHYTGEELGLGHDACIFFDREDIRTGDRWRSKLSGALKKSKCIVCVLSPNYFQSEFCWSELDSFIARSNTTGTELVVCASRHDGENFPPSFTSVWQYEDFTSYCNTAPSFWQSSLAVDFDPLLRRIACDLADKIRRAPPYSDNFPVTLKNAPTVNKLIARPADVL